MRHDGKDEPSNDTRHHYPVQHAERVDIAADVDITIPILAHMPFLLFQGQLFRLQESLPQELQLNKQTNGRKNE